MLRLDGSGPHACGSDRRGSFSGLLTASLLVLWTVAASADPAAADADRVLGLWLTEKQDAHVLVERDGDSYSGKIVWLKEPQYPADDPQHMAGQDKVDRENPDPKRRGDPILGLRIVAAFRFRDGEWRDGTIYDPEIGKTYRCRMWFDGETLRVRGYIGIPLFGRSTNWTRVP